MPHSGSTLRVLYAAFGGFPGGEPPFIDFPFGKFALPGGTPAMGENRFIAVFSRKNQIVSESDPTVGGKSTVYRNHNTIDKAGCLFIHKEQ